MAASEYSVQKMLGIFEKFANEHNLRFSSDQHPFEMRTKCIAFFEKPQVEIPCLLFVTKTHFADPYNKLSIGQIHNGRYTDHHCGTCLVQKHYTWNTVTKRMSRLH